MIGDIAGAYITLKVAKKLYTKKIKKKRRLR